jgi:hypothetical protein
MELVVIWIFCGIVASIVASNKGRSGCGWFILGVFLGPFAFAVALLPKVESRIQSQGSGPDVRLKNDEKRPADLSHRDTKVCPQCAEEVKAAAKICRFCRYEFPESSSQTGVEKTEPVAWEKAFTKTAETESPTMKGYETKGEVLTNGKHKSEESSQKKFMGSSCRDGNCTGTLDEIGICRVCGKPYGYEPINGKKITKQERRTSKREIIAIVLFIIALLIGAAWVTLSHYEGWKFPSNIRWKDAE